MLKMRNLRIVTGGRRRLVTALNVKFDVVVIRKKTRCWHITDIVPCFINNDVIILAIITWPLLWSRGNIVASHVAGPGSIPCRVNFLVEVSFRGFPSTVRQMSGNLGHIRPRLSYGHHISSKPNIIPLRWATVSDHRSGTWPSLNNNNRGRRVIGISGSMIWSKTLMELIFNYCGEFRWSGRPN